MSTAPAALAVSRASTPRPDPYSPSYGHPYRHGAVPMTGQQTKMRSFQASQTSTTAASYSKTLTYGGGLDNIGVTSGPPKVYLVFWGSQWGTQRTNASGDMTFSNDPGAGAPYIQELFKGLGTAGEQWSGIATQYCDGPLVAAGAVSCPSDAAHVGYPAAGALAGVWYDRSSAEPQQATANQLAGEAANAANHFGNSTAASNRYAQYFILSATGLDPDLYLDPNTGFCAWHDFTSDPTLDGGGAVTSSPLDIAFTNMPYLMDTQATCGAGYVNSPGVLDGYSIVAGHEYSETLTDQNPVGGWTNNNFSSVYYGEENADECAWSDGISRDVTLTTGTFAMQSTWSNSANACVMSAPIVLNDFVKVLSGDLQSVPAGTPVPKPLAVAVTDALGSPLSGVAVTFSAPSSGATVTFGSPCSGTSCTVTTDSNGDATSPPMTAGVTAGSFTVSASTSAVLTPASFHLTDSPPPPPTPFEVAFQSSGAVLWSVGNAGWTNWNLGVAPGTSPSNARLGSASYQTAFQATGGDLWTVGSAGWTDWHLGMAPGTSPSIAKLSNGGYQIAFQASGGALWTVGTAGWTDWGVGMAPGTSPSMVALPNGGYEIAFQAFGGGLWTVGTAGWTDWGVGMAPGTSPSAFAPSASGYEVAFQAFGGALWTVGSAGWTDWNVGVSPGTSPASVRLSTGGYELAFQAPGGGLWTVGTAGWNDWGLGMAPGSSPSLTAVGSGFEVAFQAFGGALWTVGSAGWTAWPLGLGSQTSPSLS